MSLTLVATNTVHYVFGLRARWIGLAVAMGVSILSTVMRQPNDWHSWLLTVPNAFVIFASSAGIAGMAAAKRRLTRNPRKTAAVEELALVRTFWSPWFPAAD